MSYLQQRSFMDAVRTCRVPFSAKVLRFHLSPRPLGQILILSCESQHKQPGWPVRSVALPIHTMDASIMIIKMLILVIIQPLLARWGMKENQTHPTAWSKVPSEEYPGRLIFSRALGMKVRDCGEVLESDPELKYVSNCSRKLAFKANLTKR